VSIFDYNTSDSSPGFVIALELLDNLPHDKLTTDNFGVVKETHVNVYPPNTKLNPDERLKLPVQPLMGSLTKKLIGHDIQQETPQSPSHPSSPEPMREQFNLVKDPLLLEALEKVCSHAGQDSKFLRDQLTAEKPNVFSKENIRLWHHLQYPDTTQINSQFEALQESLAARERSGTVFTPQQVSSILDSTTPSANNSSPAATPVVPPKQAPPIESKFRLRDIRKWLTANHWRRLASNAFSQTST